MEGLLTTLAENWAVIANAPLAFVIWTLVLLGICWAILSYAKGNQIGNLESRLALRDDEIANYKRQLEGATPDEARERIERLETELAALKPRRITPEQMEAIKRDLTQTGRVTFTSDAASNDAALVATELARAFHERGWQVSTPVAFGPAFRPPSGIGVSVGDISAPSPQEAAVLSALKAAGLSFDVQALPEAAPHAVGVMVAAQT